MGRVSKTETSKLIKALSAKHSPNHLGPAINLETAWVISILNVTINVQWYSIFLPKILTVYSEYNNNNDDRHLLIDKKPNKAHNSV